MNCDEVQPLLHAFMDGELEFAESDNLDRHLSSCTECRHELDHWSALRSRIRESMAYYRAPRELERQVRFALSGAIRLDTPAKSRPGQWRLLGTIAAAIFICISLSIPMFLRVSLERRNLENSYVAAHSRALLRGGTDVTSTDQHTVKPWLAGKLPFSPPVSDLASEGFPLQGGRVDYIAGSPAAALVYLRRLHRIDVFVQPSAERSSLSEFTHNGFNAIAWQKDNFIFTAVSDLNAGELHQFARLLGAH
jgi:anti-sigma factor RsiW